MLFRAHVCCGACGTWLQRIDDWQLERRLERAIGRGREALLRARNLDPLVRFAHIHEKGRLLTLQVTGKELRHIIQHGQLNLFRHSAKPVCVRHCAIANETRRPPFAQGQACQQHTDSQISPRPQQDRLGTIPQTLVTRRELLVRVGTREPMFTPHGVVKSLRHSTKAHAAPEAEWTELLLLEAPSLLGLALPGAEALDGSEGESEGPVPASPTDSLAGYSPSPAGIPVARHGFNLMVPEGSVVDAAEDVRWLVYKTCRFGCAWAAFWWARVAAGFVRSIHLLILVLSHFLSNYADDSLSLLPVRAAPRVACLQTLFACELGTAILAQAVSCQTSAMDWLAF